ncbi:MAG: stage V sporulation protein AD [Clostridia bacterium]|nr:stage V sporulation protein AD [Clostridia bacterium]
MLDRYYLENRILNFDKSYIVEGYTIAGPKENDGRLHATFDMALKDDMFGQTTFERAERKMFEHCISGAISKANMQTRDIDYILGGDILNQNVSASYACRKFHCGYVGLYNACATYVESLIVASSLLQSGARTALCVSGSHFSTVERQYRYPLELGVLRSPMTQWTVTGVGATVLQSEKDDLPKVTRGMFGRVIDYGIMDINNMGAAMAPAACDTLVTYFERTNTKPSDYDLIVTGDLGKLGKDILIDLMSQKGYDVSDNYADCGAMLFFDDQKTYQGGSGPACSALGFNALFLSNIRQGNIKKMLLVGTGALMSSTVQFQGDSIAAVAHLVEISR